MNIILYHSFFYHPCAYVLYDTMLIQESRNCKTSPFWFQYILPKQSAVQIPNWFQLYTFKYKLHVPYPFKNEIYFLFGLWSTNKNESRHLEQNIYHFWNTLIASNQNICVLLSYFYSGNCFLIIGEQIFFCNRNFHSMVIYIVTQQNNYTTSPV